MFSPIEHFKTLCTRSTKAEYNEAIRSKQHDKLQSAIELITNKMGYLESTLSDAQYARDKAKEVFDSAYNASPKKPTLQPVRYRRRHNPEFRLNIKRVEYMDAQTKVAHLVTKINQYNGYLKELQQLSPTTTRL